MTRATDLTQIPRVSPGDPMRAGDFNSLGNAILRLRDRRGVEVVSPPSRVCILDEELPAAKSSKKGSKALATVCDWDDEKEAYLEPSDRSGVSYEDDPDQREQIEVWNHSEESDHDPDTFGVAVWHDGHYWFAGDCDAMDEREFTEDEEED